MAWLSLVGRGRPSSGLGSKTWPARVESIARGHGNRRDEWSGVLLLTATAAAADDEGNGNGSDVLVVDAKERYLITFAASVACAVGANASSSPNSCETGSRSQPTAPPLRIVAELEPLERTSGNESSNPAPAGRRLRFRGVEWL